MTGGGTMPALRIEAVTKTFGALKALDALSLTVPAGSVFGLIGPNGSGKTTLFNVVTGVWPATMGRVFYRDQEITRLETHRIARLGIARTFQNLKVFKRLTVLQNVLGAQTSLPEVSAREHLFPDREYERRRRERVDELLETVGLAHRRDHLAMELPLGGQRRLELARALARDPDLLLLDEPAGGMTPQETNAMATLISHVAETGPTIILIDHKMGLVMRLCHRIAVLTFGRMIAEGSPDEIQAHRGVREAYLGREAVHA